LGYREGAVFRLVADDQASHAGVAAMDGVDEGVDGLDGVLAEDPGGAPASDEGDVRLEQVDLRRDVQSRLVVVALATERLAPLPTVGGGQGRDLLDFVVAQHARRAKEPALGFEFCCCSFLGSEKVRKMSARESLSRRSLPSALSLLLLFSRV
jgi:hypothetical protein